MPITVIPADDNSGAIAGWEMLAQAARERAARLHQEQRGKKVAYQALVEKLSDPSTTEEQQNAILSQDPAQFRQTYGVPITQVGKDVTTLKGGPAVDTPAARKYAAESGAPTTTKRVLVEHPGGTAAEQQQRATLASTEAGTAAEQQKTEYYKQGVRLNEGEAMRAQSSARQVVKTNFRTTDGKVPTLNQTDAFIRGEFDLYPTTEGTKRLDMIREIIGGDPNDPAIRIAALSLMNDQAYDKAKLESLLADKNLTDAKVAEMAERLKLIQSGIDPDTGKSLTGGTQIDTTKLLAVNKAFGETFNNALGPIGATASATTNSPWFRGVDWFTVKQAEIPGFGAAVFGNGIADPAAVRVDLENAILGEPTVDPKTGVAAPRRHVKSVKFPVFDQKTGIAGTVDMTLDQAVMQATQIRRKLATELPALFQAMGTLDPNVLGAMMQGNPMMQQAARAYAPDLAKIVDDARARAKAAATATAVEGAALADPNTAPLIEMRDRLQREIDDMRRMFGGQANPQPRTDTAR